MSSISIPRTQTRVTLRERPKAAIVLGETFTIEKDVPVPQTEEEIGEGNVLVEVWHLSLDPAMRGWLNDTRSYMPPVQIGEVMRSQGLGRVVAGNAGPDQRGETIRVGEWVIGSCGWQEYAVMKTKTLKKAIVPEGAILSDHLGVLGLPGQTAYWGLKEVAKVKKGETVVVTGAAGAVGIVACQIAKHVMGARVIAIAGSPEKCSWLVDELGVDAALNYKDSDFQEQFRKTVGFLDVMFDNVGGEILNLALSRLKPYARIALCGGISDYNSRGAGKGLTNYLALIGQKASLLGFLVFDWAPRFPEAEKDIGKWMLEGKIKRRETRMKGLENAPKGLLGLFQGTNTGKMILTVKEEESSKL